jgi:hypothetical protein
MPPDEVIAELVLPVDTAEYLWRNGADCAALSRCRLKRRERFASP